MATSIISPEVDTRAALSGYHEAVDSATRYLRTMASIMLNELCESAGEGLDTNDPTSVSQRRFAILDCMEKYLDDIDAAGMIAGDVLLETAVIRSPSALRRKESEKPRKTEAAHS